jgi:hydroxymethylbilane synthase
MSQRPIRLGTRRSLLARAQSSAVARMLERAHPGLVVELVGIDTRGDRILDVPLSQVEGKEFFTAEIDAALRTGAVDVTVHSFKDLSLERPAELHLAAVPKRENPRDVIFFASDVARQLERGVVLRIGSSSPRRQAFVPGFLERALPHRAAAGAAGGAARVQLCELRGNVDTRLRRLRESRGSERHLDGVVLAFAGLARLWQDEAVGAGPILRELLDGLPRMVLPLDWCPAAPAQGALAVECRSDDAATRALLAAIDHAPTRADISAERALLAERGGGCHQRFGATQRQADGLGTLLYVREAEEAGKSGDAGAAGAIVAATSELRWRAPAPPRGIMQAWDGSAQPAPEVETLPGASAACARGLAGAPAAFIAHRRALPELPAIDANRCVHIWVPGSGTWFALAARGVWVEGCAESLGFGALESTIASPLLALPPTRDWLALTSSEAAQGWGDVPVLATYRHRPLADAHGAAASGPPAGCTQAWWHSAVQFDRWHSQVGAGCQHACGPGKTAEAVRKAGVKALTVFPSVQHWREWLRS